MFKREKGVREDEVPCKVKRGEDVRRGMREGRSCRWRRVVQNIEGFLVMRTTCSGIRRKRMVVDLRESYMEELEMRWSFFSFLKPK